MFEVRWVFLCRRRRGWSESAEPLSCDSAVILRGFGMSYGVTMAACAVVFLSHCHFSRSSERELRTRYVSLVGDIPLTFLVYCTKAHVAVDCCVNFIRYIETNLGYKRTEEKRFAGTVKNIRLTIR